LDFQATVRTAKRTGEWIDDKLARTPFKGVAEQWYVGTQDLQPTTRAAYRSMLKTYILPGLGHYAVGKITPSVLRTFLVELPEELSDTRKRHVFRTLVPIFNLAVDDGMIRTSPTAAKSVKRGCRSRPRRRCSSSTPASWTRWRQPSRRATGRWSTSRRTPACVLASSSRCE
jgi:hypothetical protein